MHVHAWGKPMSDPASYAALAVCESILLTLVEERVVDRDKVQELLEDAIETHITADPAASDPAERRKAARLIEEIIISLSAVADENQP